MYTVQDPKQFPQPMVYAMGKVLTKINSMLGRWRR